MTTNVAGVWSEGCRCVRGGRGVGAKGGVRVVAYLGLALLG